MSLRTMMPRASRAALVILAGFALGLPFSTNAKTGKTAGPMKEIENAPDQLKETKQLDSSAWKGRLTPEQYRILRQAGTERPNGAVYEQFKKQGPGTYYCAGCGAKLFSSAHKFDSHCGWPSFWDPAKTDSLETRVDMSMGMKRTEVVCANCKGHLGHLFEGEGFNTPTDERYCINGTVLVFVPDRE